MKRKREKETEPAKKSRIKKRKVDWRHHQDGIGFGKTPRTQNEFLKSMSLTKNPALMRKYQKYKSVTFSRDHLVYLFGASKNSESKIPCDKFSNLFAKCLKTYVLNVLTDSRLLHRGVTIQELLKEKIDGGDFLLERRPTLASLHKKTQVRKIK
jgi:hypothetical protein